MTSAPSPRTRINRKAQRAAYDSATIKAILDAALICHIAFNDEQGAHCLPMTCWRHGEALYIHGANNSRLMRQLVNQQSSVAVTHLDGLVLARSAFHHSMNFRSVVIYGQFEAVTEPEHKAEALAAFLEHVSPGRGALTRPSSPAEIVGTTVLRLPLSESAAKIRNWGVEDSPEDMTIPVWAGVVPLGLQAGALQPEAGAEAYPPPNLLTSLA